MENVKKYSYAELFNKIFRDYFNDVEQLLQK